MPSLPFSLKHTLICCRSSTVVSAKMLRTSSSIDQDLLSGQRIVGVVAHREHAALGLGQARHAAVQEQRGLVEQALGRARILHDHALRQAPQLGDLLAAELLAGVDHHRYVAQAGIVRRSSSSSSKPVTSGRVRSSTTQSNGRAPSAASASAPVAASVMLTSSAAEQLDQAAPLRLVVLDDQQVAAGAGIEAVHAGELGHQPLARRPA